MTKRESAIAHVRAQVAKDGKVDKFSLRRYIETRSMSYATFQDVIRSGMAIYNRSQVKP